MVKSHNKLWSMDTDTNTGHDTDTCNVQNIERSTDVVSVSDTNTDARDTARSWGVRACIDNETVYIYKA